MKVDWNVDGDNFGDNIKYGEKAFGDKKKLLSYIFIFGMLIDSSQYVILTFLQFVET